MIKVLNMFSGIGGSRRGFQGDITAVELDKDISEIYSDIWDLDTVHNTDAIEFVTKHHAEFDFIWASPPCPTHSQYRYNVGVRGKGFDGVVPDMTSLYGLITFLGHHHNGLWAVENVRPYYEPLIKPTAKVGRHLIWSNFPIPDLDLPSNGLRENNSIEEASKANGFDLSKYKVTGKRKILRNCTDARVGEHVFNCATKEISRQKKNEQEKS